MPAVISLKIKETQTVKELRCLFLGHKWGMPTLWVGYDATHTCTVCGKTEKIMNSNDASGSFEILNTQNSKGVITTTAGWRYNSK